MLLTHGHQKTSNPQNPTGATLSRTVLTSVVDVAREHAIFIHSDEVYRPLFHSLNDDEERPPSILAFNYPKSLATGSMSKAFSLAGIRLGWIASPSIALIDAFASTRDYTTISVSQLDDAVAAFALSEAVVQNLLARNVALARSNLALVSAFVEDHEATCCWAKPTAGTTAFVRFERGGKPVDDIEFCKRVLEKTGVLLAPGSTCFGEGEVFQGFVRIGYVQETQVMVDGLNALRTFMREEFAKVPLAA